MIEFLLGLNLTKILSAVSATVTAAALWAAMTPTPKDDGILLKIRKVVDMLALNVGNAKNKD